MWRKCWPRSSLQRPVSGDKLADPVLARARGREVLLVDDSSVALAQLRDTLSQLGVKLHVASDGLKALRLLKGWADAGRTSARSC